MCWRALVANIQRLLLVQGFEPVGYWQGYIFSDVNYTYIVSSVTSHGRRTFRKKKQQGCGLLIKNVKSNQDVVNNVIISTGRFIDRQILLDNVSADNMRMFSFSLS